MSSFVRFAQFERTRFPVQMALSNHYAVSIKINSIQMTQQLSAKKDIAITLQFFKFAD